jgi:hypothetical protein
MFKKDSNLWHTYHNERDFSYLGYDNQNLFHLFIFYK